MKNQSQAPVKHLSIQIEQVNERGLPESENLHLVLGDTLEFNVSFEIPFAGFTMKLSKKIKITVV